MKRNIRKTLLSMLISMGAMTAGAATAFTMSAVTFGAADAMGTTRFEMVDGAGVRVNDPTGMRFKTRFSKDYYDELTTTDASLFVAIFPYADYSAYQVSNKDMPDWLEEKYGSGKYINIEISEESFYTIAEDDCYYANAVISNLYFNNYPMRRSRVEKVKICDRKMKSCDRKTNF